MNKLQYINFFDIGLSFLVNNDIVLYNNHTAKTRNLLISEQNELNLLGTEYIPYRFLFTETTVKYTEEQLRGYLLMQASSFSCKNIIINSTEGADSFTLVTNIKGGNEVY